MVAVTLAGPRNLANVFSGILLSGVKNIRWIVEHSREIYFVNVPTRHRMYCCTILGPNLSRIFRTDYMYLVRSVKFSTGILFVGLCRRTYERERESDFSFLWYINLMMHDMDLRFFADIYFLLRYITLRNLESTIIFQNIKNKILKQLFVRL